MSMITVIETLADDLGGTVRYGYSGRGMYGKECLGIVIPYPSEWIEIVNERSEDLFSDDVWCELERYSMDSMGLDSIVYWPNISVDNNEENEPFNESEENDMEAVEMVEEVVEAPVEAGVLSEEEVAEAPVEEAPVEEAPVEEAHVEAPSVALTEKQELVLGVARLAGRSFVASDLVESSGLSVRQLAGVFSGLSKKGLISKVGGRWQLV